MPGFPSRCMRVLIGDRPFLHYELHALLSAIVVVVFCVDFFVFCIVVVDIVMTRERERETESGVSCGPWSPFLNESVNHIVQLSSKGTIFSFDEQISRIMWQKKVIVAYLEARCSMGSEGRAPKLVGKRPLEQSVHQKVSGRKYISFLANT